MKLKAYLLCPVADEHPLYRDWIGDCPVQAIPVKQFDTSWQPPEDAHVVITHVHYRWEEMSIMKRIKDQGMAATLVLADGILEYRNTFEHPDLPDGAMFQPLLADKLACIGRSQARTLESWGNVGKCEVVGLPRLDSWIETLKHRPAPPDDSFNVLVATARTPYFNQKQRSEIVEAIRDLKNWFDQDPEIDSRPCRIRWRLTEELVQEAGIGNGDASSMPLAEALADCHAVMTTPSTLYLEAALAGRPVALINYGNDPQYVPAAWSVHGRDDIEPTVRRLAAPDPGRLLFQETTLDDALACRTAARPRMHQLVWEMALATQRAKESGQSIQLPARILADEQLGFQSVSPAADLSFLFSDNPAFQSSDVTELQTELSQAVARLAHYPDAYFVQKKTIRDLHHFINWLRTRMRNRNDRIQSLVAQVEELKSKLLNRPDCK